MALVLRFKNNKDTLQCDHCEEPFSVEQIYEDKYGNIICPTCYILAKQREEG